MSKKLAYAIVHRHGHRTPSSNLFRSQAEVDFWSAYLPHADEVLAVTDRFTITSDPGNERPRDLESQPFGLLTHKGLVHMKDVGAAVARRFPDIAQASAVHVTSTNYNRTQLSAQAVLYGMGLCGRDVQVRSPLRCPMSMYDSNPTTAKSIFKRIQAGEDFAAVVQSAEELKRRMIAAIPELAEHKGGFDWFGAFDYYTCRRGHDIGLAPEMEPHEVGTMQHVVDRYQLYNTDPQHSASFSVPLLQAIVDSLRPAESLQVQTGPVVSVFSCHDTNLLGLLYSLRDLGVSYRRPGEEGGADGLPEVLSWPGFGTSIVFELVSSDSGDPAESIINVYYNLEPLKFFRKEKLLLPHSVDHIVSNDSVYIIPNALSVAPYQTAAGAPDTALLFPVGEDLLSGVSLGHCRQFVDTLMRSEHKVL